MFDTKDVQENKAWAAIGYVGILCFAPLLLRQKSAFAQKHAKQGAVLFITEVAAFFMNIIPFLGLFLWVLLGLFCLIMSIIGIFKALSGEAWEVPIIGKYSKNIEL